MNTNHSSDHVDNGLKKRKPVFNKFGQYEPPTVRIKNIINQYVGDTKGIGLREIVKELTQNADDAGATKVHFILDKRYLPAIKAWDEWKILQGPSFCVYNNAIFTDSDIECIQKLGVGSKGKDPDKTGQFGIGFNVVYQMTDCPSLLSNGVDLCMFDPHLKYVPGSTNGCPGGHINLEQEPEFRQSWDDVLKGYLGEYFELRNGTIFRFPLRTQSMDSKISTVTYGNNEMKQMERDLEDYDFRMFLHTCLIFTKHIDQISISIIQADGRKDTYTEVNRKISPNDKYEIKKHFQTLGREIKSVMSGQMSVNTTTKASTSYNMVIEDEFNTTEWMVNQTFGFHGVFDEDELEFLHDFLYEDTSGKKFSPIAGVAAKRDAEPLNGSSFCFLQLPIETGLPVHINGHFAIHSSRRSLWTNTAFGNWNKILLHHVLVPSYCNFMKHASKQCKEVGEVESWYLNLFPNGEQATEQYYSDLTRDVFHSMIHSNLAVIPLVRATSLTDNDDDDDDNDATETLAFHSAKDLYFVSEKERNEEVEKILLVVGVNICKYSSISSKFLEAKVSTIDFITPRIAVNCLKNMTSTLRLPQHISQTPYKNVENVRKVLEYCIGEDIQKEYLRLDGLPLCVTEMENVREFRRRSPVFISLEFKDLLPDNRDLFLHEDLSNLFDIGQSTLIQNSPIRNLIVQDIPTFTNLNSPYISDINWIKQMWVFLRENITRYNGRSVMYVVKDLPLLTATDGKTYKVADGKSMVNIYSASNEMRGIIKKLEIPLFDAEPLLSDKFTEEDASELASYCVLDAGAPEDILHLMTVFHGEQYEFTDEECEILLHYFKNGIETISKSKLFQKTLRMLPIFETIDGDYRSLASTSRASVLDDSIPTKGMSDWMNQSDCLLLKEKKSCTDVYHLLGLGTKNTMDIYTDQIFPNFDTFDAELRMSHVICIRDKIIPMLNSFATPSTKEAFSNELQKLEFIQDDNNEFRLACDFFDSDLQLLGQLDGIRSLPIMFRGPEWKELLKMAGMKAEVTSKHLIECAEAISQIEDKYEATRQAKIIMQTAFNNDFELDVLDQLAVIPFIPMEQLDIDEELQAACPAKHENEYMCLKGTLQHESKKDRTIIKHDNITWSVVPTLPKWVNLSQELMDRLGILEEPTVSHVCNHVINLCIAVTDELDDTALKSFENVMIQVYDFLMNICDCDEHDCESCREIHELFEANCMVLNDGTIRVKGKQLVLNFPSDIDSDTLHPYIYARPLEFAKYDELFIRLGAYEVPKPNTFADILKSLHTDCGHSHLKTNQKQTASTAFYGLIVTLEQDKENSLDTRPLYLPSEQAVMHLSTELIVKDNKILARKFKNKKYEYLCKLNSIGNLTKPTREYINLLPSDVRPRILTDMVQQTIKVTSVCRIGKRCAYMSEYAARMKHDDFARALVHLSQASESKLSEVKDNIDKIRQMEIVCFREIKCYLSEKGIATEVINTPKLVHFEKNVNGKPVFYMKHCDWYPGEADVISSIADALKSIITGDIGLSLDSGKIAKLLRCPNTKEAIDEFLIEEGVAQAEEDMMSRPTLGTVVPIEQEWMYSCDPDIRFQPKEYVAYIKPNIEPSVMIHARIVRECKSKKNKTEEVSNIFREYVIDIGLEQAITAQSLDLFREVKMHTPEVNKTRSLIADMDGSEERMARIREKMELQDVKRQCTRLLEEVFSDPMRVDERDKLRKRLYLKWHPDKAGGTWLATEVFKHLKDEVERLTGEYPNYRCYGKSQYAFKQDQRTETSTHFNYQQRQQEQSPTTQPPMNEENTGGKAKNNSTKQTEHSTNGQNVSNQHKVDDENVQNRSENRESQEIPTSRAGSESSKSPVFSSSEDEQDDVRYSKRNDDVTSEDIEDKWFDPKEDQTDEEDESPNENCDKEDTVGYKNGEMNGHEEPGPFDPTIEWFKQAKRDMDCALLLKGQNNNEWVCSICYEVVRKLLMGTLSSLGRSVKEFQMSRFLPKLMEKIVELPDHPKKLQGDIDVLRRLNANYLFNFDGNIMSESRVEDTYTNSVTNQALETTHNMTLYMTTYCDLNWDEL